MTLGFLVAAGCTGGGSADSTGGGDSAGSGASGATQTNEGGSVTIEATWVTPDHLAEDEKVREVGDAFSDQDVVLVHVTMDTHSVDLSSYELGTLAQLDAGQGPRAPIEWRKISDSAHHTEGVLVFAGPASAPDATLTIPDLADVPERQLSWSLAGGEPASTP
jgi:hypothetical protein